MARRNPKLELIHQYLSAAGVVSVRIPEIFSGHPGTIGISFEFPPDSPAVISGDKTEVLWFGRRDHAEMVLSEALEAIGAPAVGQTELPAEVVRDHLVNAAASLGAPWHTTAEIMAAAERAVDEVERYVVALNASGGLKQINAAYKKYRASMQATKEPAISYSAYLQSYKVRIIRIVAQNAASAGNPSAPSRQPSPPLQPSTSEARPACESSTSEKLTA